MFRKDRRMVSQNFKINSLIPRSRDHPWAISTFPCAYSPNWSTLHFTSWIVNTTHIWEDARTDTPGDQIITQTFSVWYSRDKKVKMNLTWQDIRCPSRRTIHDMGMYDNKNEIKFRKKGRRERTRLHASDRLPCPKVLERFIQLSKNMFMLHCAYFYAKCHLQ